MFSEYLVVRRVLGGRLPVARFPFPVLGPGACAVSAEREVAQLDNGDDAGAKKERQQAAHVTCSR